MKKIFVKKLFDLLENGTCAYTCTDYIKKILDNNGFVELKENEEWRFNNDKYYVIRNDASIIAFSIPKKVNSSFSIITTHLDTPSLLLKPNGSYLKENYLKYNVMPYGGLLNYSWLDHPLSLAGRIIIKTNNTLEKKIVDFKKPMLIVPSVAIHQKTDANSNLDLNMHIDMQPIITLANDKKNWDKIMNKEICSNIIDYDLFAYNISKPYCIGQNNELLISPRIDNLTSVYAALESFLDSDNNNLKVFCAFNNEEIGSLTVEGADSNFLLDILKRIAATQNIDITISLANSMIISSDNTHAIHPNHTEFADDTGVAYLGDGLTIIKEPQSTTNAVASSIIKTICSKYKIKYQDATSKNDIAGGSTLSGISLSHVSVLSIDVGVCELSMHSSVETCCINDIYELYKMMKAFYNTKIEIKKENISLHFKN